MANSVSDKIGKTITYQNPIISADYSDPDVIRVGDDYYLTASSFSNAPGLPVLHSKDLVHWEIINYACKTIPDERYSKPRHGCGIWAPAIRYHNNKFYIYFPMPDEGIFVTTADDPAGEWSKPVCVRAGSGYIDPCPFWDDDGKAYLACAVAFSRFGKKSILLMAPMSEDGTTLVGEFTTIYDGNHTENETIEGPKIYKKNGFYYIFAPAGGVKVGHQTVLRSRDIFGPYEYRVVLKQGSSAVNGPHQGAWVDTPFGEEFFIHFQDMYALGRIVHMQPLIWENDWPIIGKPVPGETWGEPVDAWEITVPAEDGLTDDTKAFNQNASSENADAANNPEWTEVLPIAERTTNVGLTNNISLNWQWNSNYEDSWYSVVPGEGLRLNAVAADKGTPLSDERNLLLRKWPAAEFTCSMVFDLSHLKPGDFSGIVSLGQVYAGLGVVREEHSYKIVEVTGKQTFKHGIAEIVQEKLEEIAEKNASEGEGETDILTFCVKVRIKDYEDYLDRVDYRGQEQWARHIPKEEVTLSVYDGEYLGEAENDSTEARKPMHEFTIPAVAGRWVGVKNGAFCVHFNLFEANSAEEAKQENAGGYVVIKNVKYSN